MKPEDHAWKALRSHAAGQLKTGFADRVLRSAQGPDAATWESLRAHGGRQLRPGFAGRVLRAARELPGVPSILDQFALSVGTAAVCALAIFYFDARSARIEDERNLASWQQMAQVVADDDVSL
jgi:hypothetical protein